MSDGIFLVNYTGKAGFGSAVLTIAKGEIFGVDVVGCEYRGSYKIDNADLNGAINLYVPAGVSLATGAPASSQPYIVPLSFVLPIKFEEQQIIQIRLQLPSGSINANVKKVKNLTF